jgi:hypothetical protein
MQKIMHETAGNYMLTGTLVRQTYTVYKLIHTGDTNTKVRLTEYMDGRVDIHINAGVHEGYYLWSNGDAYTFEGMGTRWIDEMQCSLAKPGAARICTGAVWAISTMMELPDNMLLGGYA